MSDSLLNHLNLVLFVSASHLTGLSTNSMA